MEPVAAAWNACVHRPDAEMLHFNGYRMAGVLTPSGHQARRSSRVALLILVLLCEVSVVALPALARVPARSAAAIVETRLRAAPERRAAPLLRLPEGATVTVHGKPENGWYLVRRGELEGYVRTGDVATDPIILASDAQPNELVDDPTVARLEQRASGRGRVRERRGARDREGRPRDSRETITTKDLNLRESPSQNAHVAAVMPRGERVNPTGKHSDGFVEVRWQDVTGWAFGKHLAAPRRIAMKTGGARDRDSGSWRRRELIEIIYAAADKYGQSREDMLRVARCESDLVPSAVNGPGGSYGLFQFKPGTWLGTPFGEYDVFDPRANANAAAWMWAQGRRREWVCQ